MNLSSLTSTNKTKLAAELDGWTISHEVAARPLGIGNAMSKPKTLWKKNDSLYEEWQMPQYATSYDAIIPLIQKLGTKVELKVLCNMNTSALSSTPSQLLDALLVAAGKVTI